MEDPQPDESIPPYACKHCSMRGSPCLDCETSDGDGWPDERGDADTLCHACKGEGVLSAGYMDPEVIDEMWDREMGLDDGVPR